MADSNTEDVMVGLEELMRNQFYTYLKEVAARYNDGVILEPLVDITWEEHENFEGLSLPSCMILAQEEADPTLKDQMLDVTVFIVLGIFDSSARAASKKIFRYGRALKAMFRPNNNRTLSQRIVSSKVVRIRWSPPFSGPRDNDYSRAFEAEVVCRVHQNQ